MTWQEGAAYGLVVVGLLAGLYIAGQRPSFWIEFGGRIIARLWPLIMAAVMKRMSAEEEAEWRAAQQAGRGDEWLRKRMRRGKPGRER